MLALPGVEAVRAAGVFLVSYLVTSLGVFGVMTMVSSPMGRRDHEDIDEYRSLLWHRPYLAAILIAMLLSLAGIPLTAGFVGKLAVIGVGVQAAQWWLVGGVVIASAIGIYYYLRVINAMLTNVDPGTRTRRRRAAVDLQSERDDAAARDDRHDLARRVSATVVRARPVPRVSVATRAADP